jgi:uncharacterized protein (TIGR03435 family)
MLATVALAQVPPPQPSAASSLSFEVATVKPNTSGSGGSHTGWNGTKGKAFTDVDTFTAVNVTLKNMMQYQAFGIPGPRIVDGPKWLESARFDIVAKLDPATIAQLKALPSGQGMPQMQSMFQQLLADRFQLKTHWETRELPVYALVVAKNGPTLQPEKDPAHGGTSAGDGQLQAVSATLADVAAVMTQEAYGELGRDVIDKTGIEGKYDIRLKWTPDTGPAPLLNGAPDPNAPPNIFTAIQEQLGLKLESTKGPVQVLVIDRAEMPSDN